MSKPVQTFGLRLGLGVEKCGYKTKCGLNNLTSYQQATIYLWNSFQLTIRQIWSPDRQINVDLNECVAEGKLSVDVLLLHQNSDCVITLCSIHSYLKRTSHYVFQSLKRTSDHEPGPPPPCSAEPKKKIKVVSRQYSVVKVSNKLKRHLTIKHAALAIKDISYFSRLKIQTDKQATFMIKTITVSDKAL